MIEIKEHVMIGYETLQASDKRRFATLIHTIEATDSIFTDATKGKLYKINLPENNFYVYRLSQKLRILIKISGDKTIIQDILTHDRLNRTFGKYLGKEQR